MTKVLNKWSEQSAFANLELGLRRLAKQERGKTKQDSRDTKQGTRTRRGKARKRLVSLITRAHKT